ncbi:(R,R)-butanediol dehydrogenase/meso-butanediol dehydrogenase/diacetyl reductase [Paenibacillus phyllosphaerae]|uniref:(R,R)-butanediol dehydrogenase/meso-butanediol dehydrogenase/diacetyl reductase n=1 Tax=Paenibacillus phyllosphaerae TaxID=274593 RepID=A0A7W5AVJ4_9BACL|nr:2,3-butanediol dehydrogenase [Paenibacillus phyllosphaerae]MBB3109590.1 (R,R)-butanediol dehydrogenase/meso-butanediol dehydrogenase/diacetyl reductase [Paenibacillus phyllosphaerae]
MSGKSAPLTLGHEFAGEIEEIGEGVNGFVKGDRVAIEPIMYCGKCQSCRMGFYNQCGKMGFVGLNDNGGFADYVLVEPYMVHKLPDNVSFEEGALVEPTAVAMHAVRQSKLKVGDSAAVYGVGPIGLLTILAAKSAGASKVYAIDVSDERLQLAEKLGAIAINSLKQNATEIILAAGGVHVAYEAAGVQPTLTSAVSSVKQGGEVMIIAAFAQPAQINMFELMVKEANVTSILAYRHIFPEIIALIADGKLDVKQIITKKIALENIIEDGLELLVKDKSQAKILVQIG